MTDHPARDLEPGPVPPPATEAPWEIVLGYFIEDVYCAHTEWNVILAQGIPDDDLDIMRSMGRWATERLHELDVPSSQVADFEEALAALPSQETFPGRLDQEWIEIRLRRSACVAQLQAATRAAVGLKGVRYFDYGFYLCRIGTCARLLRILPTAPEDFARSLPDLQGIYHKILLRVTAGLQLLVNHTPTLPHYSEHRALDREFEQFVQYLATWRRASAAVDEEFQDRLNDLMHIAGFWPKDQIKQESTWPQQDGPLSESDRLPLPVPHSSAEREALQAHWEAIIRLPAEGQRDRIFELARELLDTCRAILGPVHPLTLHVQATFAAAHIDLNRLDMATLIMLDVASTAHHYYGYGHPSKYLIIADVHSFFQYVDPQQAQLLYDSILKHLVEKDEAEISAVLHPARRTIRSALGMD